METFKTIVMYFSLLLGIGLIAFSVIILYNGEKCLKLRKVRTNVIDNRQEFTSRGFLWKDIVQLEIDGKTIHYTTRGRSFKRGYGSVVLYVHDKKKWIFERNFCFEMIFAGLLVLTVAIVLMACL